MSLASERRDAVAGLRAPVCGMAVTAESRHVLSHEGRSLHFYCGGCLARFAAEPARCLARISVE